MHKYNLQGELVKPWEEGYFSPTTILDITYKKKLHEWEKRVGVDAAEQKRNDAVIRGDIVHRAISDYFWGERDIYMPIITDEYIDAFFHWLPNPEHITDIRSEIFVYSEKYKYAGTADLICLLGDEPWVIDFKTGSEQPTHGLQLKAYQQAYYEMEGVKCRMACLYLGTGTKKGWRWKEFKEPLYVFLAHKQIFDWQLKKNPIKQPKEQWDGGMITL